MKNGELHRLRDLLKITFGNAVYINAGKEKSLNLFEPHIYKEIGRHLNIVIRYVEDIDVLLSSDKDMPEEMKITISHCLVDLLQNGNVKSADKRVDIKITDGVIIWKLKEAKAWYDSMNEVVDSLTQQY